MWIVWTFMRKCIVIPCDSTLCAFRYIFLTGCWKNIPFVVLKYSESRFVSRCEIINSFTIPSKTPIKHFPQCRDAKCLKILANSILFSLICNIITLPALFINFCAFSSHLHTGQHFEAFWALLRTFTLKASKSHISRIFRSFAAHAQKAYKTNGILGVFYSNVLESPDFTGI